MGWNTVFADLLINLAAGWFGAVFIAPNFAKNLSRKKKRLLLIQNSLTGILCLIVAHYLRNI
jgi:hypothetical protein